MLLQRYAGILFSVSVFREILRKKRSRVLSELLEAEPIRERFEAAGNLAEFYSNLHRECVRNEPSEYFAKSLIIDSLAYEKVALSADSVIGEFRVGGSIADMVLLNCTSVCLEIKTKFDKTTKLLRQLNDYRQNFDHTYAVIDKCHFNWAKEEVPHSSGIILITSDGTLDLYRASRSNKRRINQISILSSLRKNEYLDVLKHFFGFENDCPNTQLFAIAEIYFSKISKLKLHDYVVEVLKKRTQNVPKELACKNELNYLAPHIVDGKINGRTAAQIHSILLTINKGNIKCTSHS